MYSLSLITDATFEAVSLAECKAQLALSPSDNAHDQFVGGLATAARQYVETHTGLAIPRQTWDYTLDRFPSSDEPIYLPKSPTSSITHVKYYDSDGIQQTWSSAEYVVTTGRIPATVRLAWNSSWPAYRLQPDGISIRMVCGYATAAAVPRPIKQAILLLVTHWFEQRSQEVTGTITASLAHSLDALLVQYHMPDEFTDYAGAAYASW